MTKNYMNDHEHGVDCDHGHDDEQLHRHGVPAHWVVLGISFFILVLAAMFLIGMALGRGAKLAEQTPVATTTQSGNSSLPTDVLPITWFAPEKQVAREFNPTLRKWYEQDGATAQSYDARVLGYYHHDGDSSDKDYTLVAEFMHGNDLGNSLNTYFLLEPNSGSGEPVLLTNYQAGEDSFYQQNFVALGDVTFPGLSTDAAKVDAFEYPTVGDRFSSNIGQVDFLAIGILPDANQYSTLANAPVVATLADGHELRLFDAAADNNQITDNGVASNELYTFAPDNRVLWYNLDIPFFAAQNEKAPSITNVTWNDGSQVSDFTYTPQEFGGCGVTNFTNVVTGLPALVVAGQGWEIGQAAATNHSDIYEPKDFSDAQFSADFTNWQAIHANGTMAQFAASHPFFYFKDALDRYVKFTRNDVVPPGECGKPVIYLYPTQTTDINVQLAPVGGFTKSEPAYGQGWKVTASPDGSLVDKLDGKTYPYLFWEGRGGFYAEPKYFDVVAKADVDQYLTTKLGQLGLNIKETADFKEFWLPRMQSANYYKIGFHGNAVMNALAPLHLSLAPQTLIRILMDYSELASPIVAKPAPTIITPVRKGFTVVEWGGVLR